MKGNDPYVELQRCNVQGTVQPVRSSFEQPTTRRTHDSGRRVVCYPLKVLPSSHNLRVLFILHNQLIPSVFDSHFG